MKPVLIKNALGEEELENFTLKAGGKTFSCPCGCNCFHNPDDTRL